MKQNLIFITLLAFFIIVSFSCNSVENNTTKKNLSALETDAPNISEIDSGWHPFLVKINKASNLYVLGYPKEPRKICYLFNGSIINNNETIFSEATVRIKLLFELENNKILRDSEMNDNFWGGLLGSKVFRHWKPGEAKEIDRLISYDIPIDYIDYPIKSVYVRFYMETEDQINKQKQNAIIAEDDLTKQWKDVIKKCKEKIVDDDDYNFPKKIVGN